jgi:hypothetical protein
LLFVYVYTFCQYVASLMLHHAFCFEFFYPQIGHAKLEQKKMENDFGRGWSAVGGEVHSQAHHCRAAVITIPPYLPDNQVWGWVARSCGSP